MLSPANLSRGTLQVGREHWPLPVPIVKIGGKWYFDTKAGREEILFRRIGANELDAIQVCRGFVEAQDEYALDIHDDSGIHQYAQRLISTPGKQDGLYWKNADGTAGGPSVKRWPRRSRKATRWRRRRLPRLHLSRLERPGSCCAWASSTT